MICLLDNGRKEVRLMNYEVSEILEIGNAQEMIQGSDKDEPNFLDSPIPRTSMAVVDDMDI